MSILQYSYISYDYTKAMRYIKKELISTNAIEIDSLLLRYFMHKTLEVSWTIIEVVKEIWKRMSNTNIEITHIIMEGNRHANHLENKTVDKGEENT